jgi:hypothetical protein
MIYGNHALCPNAFINANASNTSCSIRIPCKFNKQASKQARPLVWLKQNDDMMSSKAILI